MANLLPYGRGGLKGIVPGIVGIETIMGLHSAKLLSNPLSTWINLNQNPVYEEIVSAGLFSDMSND